MNNFINWLDRKLVPIAAKFGNQRHLVAIRDAFASLMPVVLVGAMAVLLNNVFFVPWSLVAGYIGAEHPFIVWANANLAPFFDALSAGTLSLVSIYLAFAVGYQRAQAEGHDPLATGILSTASAFVLGIMGNADTGSFYDAKGMFIVLIAALVTSEIFFKVTEKNWVIKLPDSVPPAVGKSFSAVIPGAFSLGFWAIVAYLFTRFGNTTVYVWFQNTIANALLVLSQGVISVMLISALIPLFWFFGLHGANLLEGVLQPIYGQLALNNIDMFQQGVRAVGGEGNLSVWVRGSWDAYVFLGGSGATLGLLIAIFMFSKVQQNKEIAKLGIPTGVFMINEPVIFGLPIVLNPTFFIPFVINQPILALVGYIATSIGFAGPIVNQVPWTTPPILSAFLATNGSVGAAITALINLVICVLIYAPFVIMANRAEAQRLKEEAIEINNQPANV